MKITFGLLKWDPLRPEFLFICFWIAGVALQVIPFISEQDGFSLYWSYDFTNKSEALKVAFFLYSLVLVFFIVGGFLGHLFSKIHMPRFWSRRSQLTDNSSFNLRMLVVLSLGFLSILATIAILGGVNEWLVAGGDRIRQFAGFNFIVLLQNGLLSVSLVWLIRLSRIGKFTFRANKLFLLYTVIAIMLVAIQGAKSTLFVFILAFVVIWHYRVKRFTVTGLIIGGFCLFVLLMTYHVIKQEYLVVGKFMFLDENRGFWINTLDYLFKQFTGNLMQLQCLAVLVDSMPDQLDYQNGETFKMVFLIWLPSLLFPDKPPTAAGVFTLAFWPEKWLEQGTTLPPGLFGEFYMNFGLIGIFLGALLMGTTYSFFYWKNIRKQFSDNSLGVYALMAAMMLHYFRGEASSVTVLFLSMLVPLMWMLRGR